jgi:phosphatidylinositol-4,5-bisphosphate 3-kinase
LDVVSDIDIFQHRPEAIQEVPVAGANIGDNVTNETSEQKSNLLQPNKLTAPNPIATQSNVVLTVATVVNSQRRPEQTLRRRSSVMEAYQFDSPQKYESNICIEFLLMTGQVIEVETPGSQHIITIKDVIGRLARERLGLDLNMEKYLLKTPGASFLTNEDVPIKSLPYVQNCIKRNSKPQFVLLERNSVETKKIKTLNMEIGSLIGRPLCWTQQDDEITTFRQQMTRIRYFERQRAQEEANKRGGHSMFPTKLANGPFQVPSGKFLVELRTEKLPVRKTLVAFEHDTADEFLARYFEKYLAKLCPQKSSKDFVMKAAGLVEYITGPYKLHEFEYIRQCIMKDIKPELCLVEVETAPSGSSQSDILASVENEEESFLIQDPDIRYDHRDLTVSNSKVSWENMSAISAWDITRPFRFRILGVENVNSQSTNFIAALGRQAPADTAKLFLYITAGLYHGGELLDTLYTTQQVISTSNPRWYEWVKTNIKVKDLPRATRICFTLWASSSRKESHPIAWVNCQLFDYKHELRTGIISLNMWPDNKANPIGTCVQSPDTTTPMLFLQFERYATPVVFPTQRWQSETYPVPTSITPQEQQRLKFLCTADPLYPLESKDKQLLWKYRDYCTNYPRGLAKFLVSVPKTDRNAVQESYRLLDIWTKPSPHDALELLDSKFADTNVREYAVQQLENLTEDELQAYLLQLVQVLKYEPYHDSPLARFLLRHALRSRLIGHTIFWLLKSEIHVEEISERYGLLMEAYLRGCGPHLKELKAQDEFLKKLVSVANHIKNSKDSDRMKELKEQIIKINQSFPPKLVLPLNPRIEVSGLKVDKCKYMDSKKLPLWLVFQNADPQGKDIYVIFKCGDDLRQDMLTLQMIRIMDKLWKEEGLDLCMSPYQVVATGAAVGMIEVVMNAQTTAKITKEEGGGATAALFKESYLKRWLESNNPPHEHKEVIQRFIKSCAGYCVATYVLGIGDRHNDNVMVTKDGKLFHIDFGHFLGNYKKKFGIKRERAPFVFTPDFAYVMGGKDSPDFMRFTELCCKAYNIVRKHAAIFINLFALMLSTGIPELQTVEDIDYLREAFALDHNDEEAKVIFTKLIYESLACKTTQMMNAFHIAVHNN